MPRVQIGDIELYWAGALPSPAQEGGSPPLTAVFVHGAGGNHSHWVHQVAYLTRRGLGAIAFDLPGHGRSGGEAQSSVAAYAACVHQAATAILPSGRRDLVVVGHSMGGAVAIEMALGYPDRLAALVLVGTGARLRVLPAALEKMARGERDCTLLKMAYSPSAPTDLLRRAEEEFSRVPVQVLYRDYSACDAFDRMAEVGSLRIPTLVLCGHDDLLTPPKYSSYLAERTGGKLVLVPGAGHMVMLEQPQVVNEAISAFLDGLDGRHVEADGQRP